MLASNLVKIISTFVKEISGTIADESLCTYTEAEKHVCFLVAIMNGGVREDCK